MLIPDEVRDCICFLYVKTDQGPAVAGTAFFVYESFVDERVWRHTVTAKHVLEDIHRRSVDGGRVHMRCNLRAGGVGWIDVPIDDWLYHPDETKADDVAVLVGVAPSLDEFAVKSYPLDRLATDAVVQAQSIGIGDEIFLTGMFVNHTGVEQNISIVRVGNIAAMPAEPVKAGVGTIDGYLVEARSIGGLSGCPVFVDVGADRTSTNVRFAGFEGRDQSVFFLLGVIHGHWDETLGDSYLQDRAVNQGIAIVLPASKIIDILDRSEVKEMRGRIISQIESEGLPTADSASGGNSEFDNFEDLTKKLMTVTKDELDDQRRQP